MPSATAQAAVIGDTNYVHSLIVQSIDANVQSKIIHVVYIQSAKPVTTSETPCQIHTEIN